MSFRATTLVTVLRGEGADDFGDPVDTDAVAYRDVPASILETVTRQSRPVDGRTDAVRSYACRVHHNVTLYRDDRIRDQRTGDVYTVDEIITPTNPVGHTFRRLTLRRVT